MLLKSDLIIAEPLAGEPCPIDRVFALLDVLPCGAALIVKADHVLWCHWQVGDDKAHAGEQLTGMPFDPGDDTAGLVP